MANVVGRIWTLPRRADGSLSMEDYYLQHYQTNIFVNGTNASSGDGTSGNPFRTIQQAVNVANAGAGIFVAPGTYTEVVTITAAHSGIALLGGGNFLTDTWPVTIEGGLVRGNGFVANNTNTYIDGFKITQTTGPAIKVLGPGVTAAEIRHCFMHNIGGSGISVWGTTYGSNPVTNGNWRGVQNLRIHHCITEMCCNDVIGGGFDEHITVANGIYNFAIYNNRVGPSLDSPGVYSAANGGEGIDIKVGLENPVGVPGLGVYNNEIVSIQRHGIYCEAGHCSTSFGYTAPAVNRNIHIYNNLCHGIKAHGITVNAEVSSDSVADVDGRKGGQLRDIYVYYNTSYGNDADGILLYDYGALNRGITLATAPIADNVQIVNNICHSNAQGGNNTYTGVQQDHHWVTNSLIKKNVVTGTATGVRLSSGVATITGNINSDPLFTNQAAGDFTIQTGSPAKNAGGDAIITPSTDKAGNPRPFGALPDIGAFERQSA